MASYVEQNYDEKGIIWANEIAPYKVFIIIANMKDDNQVNVANKLYDNLNKKGIDSMLDDRNERIGIKFNDADLIGIPYIIIVGKNANEGLIEIKNRKTGTVELIKINEVLNRII